MTDSIALLKRKNMIVKNNKTKLNLKLTFLRVRLEQCLSMTSFQEDLSLSRICTTVRATFSGSEESVRLEVWPSVCFGPELALANLLWRRPSRVSQVRRRA